jgi:5-amino-6-(5-phosphoribosylamino)uracil reductase
MSADGYIDDASDRRLLLSNDADVDRVDAESAASDAILVGANTIRRDKPAAACTVCGSASRSRAPWPVIKPSEGDRHHLW